MTVRPASIRTLARCFVAGLENSTCTRLPFVVPPLDVILIGRHRRDPDRGAALAHPQLPTAAQDDAARELQLLTSHREALVRQRTEAQDRFRRPSGSDADDRGEPACRSSQSASSS
jgi:hypothetical protein